MHIVVNRLEFINKIRTVEKIVKENKVKPIISCIYASVENGLLKFIGTDIENTIYTTMPINNIVEEGKMTFYFNIIDEYLKEIKDEEVTFKTENLNLIVETKDSASEFFMLNPEDYPNIMAADDYLVANKKITIASQEFIAAVEKVDFAADTSPNNIAMNCVRLELEDNFLDVASTDTYRLAYFTKEVEQNSEFAASIALPASTALVKILKSMEDTEIEIYEMNNKIYFKAKDLLLTSRVIELKYPNYQYILDNMKNNKRLTINVEKFSNILKRILIFVRLNDESKYGATFNFSGNRMSITGINESAKINEKHEVDYEGDDLKISLNVKYILDFIQKIDKDENIILDFMEANSAVRVYKQNDMDYIYILMPLSLRD